MTDGRGFKQMKKEERKISIIIEVAILFLLGVITTGVMAYLSETKLSNDNVTKQTELHAEEIVTEVKHAVREYPASQWLIRYWYDHSDTLDIEYDAKLSEHTRTAKKCGTFSQRHPDLKLRYLTTAQCNSLPEEDQKLYAEITYSWLITRIDQIKQAHQVAFLFCVVAEEPYDHQFFLFSGADPGAKRGTHYEEVYPLGNIVTVNDSQSTAMRKAIKYSSHLADAGRYVDYYALLGTFDGHSILIGLTYDLSDLRADMAAQTRTGTQLAILNQLTLSLICLVLILVFVLNPLKQIQKNIRQYKQTKDSESVTEELAVIRFRNEIGQLARDVFEMAREIDAHMREIETITAEKERIGTELALATRIQADMLPSIYPAFPDRPEFDVYATMDPAKEVGGDFYDFFLVDDNHLCVVMADVSGKGVPAALFMMASKIILAEKAMADKSPARILTETNAVICANNREEMFVTVWLGILELSTGRLRAANAGHEYPALQKPGGAFELLKDKHGFVIGGMEGVKYREYELTLEPGSRLFLYTDGVTEATDAENRLFGTERMLAALNGAPDVSLVRLLEYVRRTVDRFVGEAEQFDDLTMLCLEYRG